MTAARSSEMASSSTGDEVAVLAQFVAKPGRESEVCDALLRSVGPTRAEPGNIGYDLVDDALVVPWTAHVMAMVSQPAT